MGDGNHIPSGDPAMTTIKQLFFFITLMTILVSCNANIFDIIMESVFGIKTNKRSMSELITDYLDELFPKDDLDTETMKNIYTMYNEDSNDMFGNDFSGGLEYLES
ncbi:unnamed protein product [Diatraea saccharalis]|uniref:Uncharacterized protein n=1 Tax=Diatraea saccharalis TaxID=40085 RepID=A0A9N9WK08_9NEOP|nr:unnamed protein product [Diatraea saccharalis]